MITPRRLFRTAALAEAVTWALLLTGMFLKYVTETTELGVQVFGMVHGVVFVAYCLAAVLVAVDQKWSLGRLALGLVAAGLSPEPTTTLGARLDLVGASDRVLDFTVQGRLSPALRPLVRDYLERLRRGYRDFGFDPAPLDAAIAAAHAGGG